jgi:hypothetical protein
MRLSVSTGALTMSAVTMSAGVSSTQGEKPNEGQSRDEQHRAGGFVGIRVVLVLVVAHGARLIALLCAPLKERKRLILPFPTHFEESSFI